MGLPAAADLSVQGRAGYVGVVNTSGVLAIIQAGGAGGRMDVLTAERAKPALPFAGSFQLIDFPLSNVANSGITDVWLSVQYQSSSLGDQVRNGRPWDLDRTSGGLRLLVPQEGSGSLDEDGFSKGNADELFRLRDQIRGLAPELVLVMSADHVYSLDYRDVIETHRAKEAEVTMVVTDLDGITGEDASEHGVVEVNRLGRVTDFAYKPDSPASSTITAEVFVYEPDVLLEVLEQLHHELSDEPHEGDDDVGDTGLGDFGDLLVPHLVKRGRAYAHALEGYWRDLGQPHHYLNAHLELIEGTCDVFRPGWRIRTQQPQREPARVDDGADVQDSLLGAGSHVAGSVRRSVLSPDVVVEAGAEVVESVILNGTVLRSGARVVRSIVDSGCVLGDGAVVGGDEVDLTDPDAVPLVGRDSIITTELPAGSRAEPGTTA